MDLMRPYPAAGSRPAGRATLGASGLFAAVPRKLVEMRRGQNERNSARLDAVTAAADNCKPISLLGRRARPAATAPSPNLTGAGDAPFRV